MFALIHQQFNSAVQRARAVCSVIIAATALMTGGARADEDAQLDDAAARLQYAYYTRDVQALRTQLDAVERLSMPEAMRSLRAYQLGLGYWHLAELTEKSGASSALALGRCEEHLEAAIDAQPRLAEAHAIRGLCGFLRARKTSARPLKRECREQPAMVKALDLAPRNPRVLYVAALCAVNDGNAALALDEAQRAWAAFERAQPDADVHSDWGQAETCVVLAQLQWQQGNRALARDRVEQALILAPDYVAARELLAQIAAGR
jgi:tetratricopeptide (TPR) repeat protein